MSPPYTWRHDYPPPPLELSTSGHLHSERDETVRQRDMNNRRLRQTANYLAQRGGDDSPTTFIDHVDRIDKDLLQFLSQQGGTYNSDLYRRVQAMVHEVQRDSQHAIQAFGMLIERDDDLMEYKVSSPIDALYRTGEAVDAPPAQMPKEQSPVQLRKPVSRENAGISPQRHDNKRDTNHQREKQFKYGGPSNESENWYADCPASLPFPETFMMQDLESLKIDYDLYRSASQDPKNPKTIFETKIPLDQVRRDRDNDSHRYESGSRFRLPVLSTEVLAMMDRSEIDQRLQGIVEDFNQSNKIESLINDHAPRVFLERFEIAPNLTRAHSELDDFQFGGDIGGTEGPTALRQAMNITPNKARPAKANTGDYNIPQCPTTVTPKRASAAGRRIQRAIEASYNVDYR